MFTSKIKHQRGMFTFPLDINGFVAYPYLREPTYTGGLVLWCRSGTGRAVRPWAPPDPGPDWMASERAWVLLEDTVSHIACCGVYLRVDSPRSSPLFRENQLLLLQIEIEIRALRSLGYSITLLGDFNARVSPSRNFSFTSYPHPPNNNGDLLMDFVQRTELFCMNPLSWRGIREEVFTFHRDLGSHYATSLIDYGLAEESALELTLSFSVKASSKLNKCISLPSKRASVCLLLIINNLFVPPALTPVYFSPYAPFLFNN